MQGLIADGHRWADLKHYPYCTLGAFIRAAKRREQNAVFATSFMNWMATHETDPSKFSKTLDDVLGKTKVKNSRSEPNLSVTPKKNDMDDFLAFLQSINQ